MEYQQARPAATPDEVPASSQADAAMRSVKQTVDQALQNVSERTREVVRYADRRVQASPWTAVGVSFGIGMIFGVLVTLAAGSQQRSFIDRMR